MHRAQRRRPTIAKEWQLAVLRKLQAESGNPTEEQRSAAAAETGLDEKWVRNWFIRQRSKLATRNRSSQPATTKAYSVPAFKLQLCYPPPDPTDVRSAGVDPAPYPPSPASLESRSPVNSQAIPRSHQRVATPSQNPTIPTYSRDPLCNRYPDFSQFFRPNVHQTFELSARISNHNDLVHLLDMDSHPFQGLFDLHRGNLSTHQSSSTNLQSCPVAFSMKLVDILDSSFTRHPVFPPPELGYRI